MRDFCQLKDVFSYDTSSLKRKQLVIDGDVESNPGPISSVEGYRAAIGRYYCKAVSLSQSIHVNSCYCHKYERGFSKTTRSDLNKMMKLGFYVEINYLDMSDYC